MTDAVARNLQIVLTRLAEVDDWALATGMVLFITGMCLLLAAISLIDSIRKRHLKSSRLSYGNVTFTQRPVRRKKNNE